MTTPADANQTTIHPERGDLDRMTKMKITRRTALMGAAGGIIGGLPIGAHSAPIRPLSPLLPILTGNVAALYRSSQAMLTEALSPWQIARYYNGNPDSLQNYPPAPAYEICLIQFGQAVDSVYAAEDILLTYAPIIEHDLLFSEAELWDRARRGFLGPERPAPHVLLNRQCNLIASRTRRGAGNLAMMHPATLQALIHDSPTAINLLAKPELVGRWTKMGTMNGYLPIYASSHMPALEVVIMYRGNDDTLVGGNPVNDFGAVLLDRSDGLTLIDDVRRPDLLASSVASYLARVRFRYPS